LFDIKSRHIHLVENLGSGIRFVHVGRR
jgi:hypothetical protein